SQFEHALDRRRGGGPGGAAAGSRRDRTRGDAEGAAGQRRGEVPDAVFRGDADAQVAEAEILRSVFVGDGEVAARALDDDVGRHGPGAAHVDARTDREIAAPAESGL